MQYFRFKEDRLPVAFIILLFFCDLVVYFAGSNILFLLGWMFIWLFAKIFIAAWNHHHQHVNTFKQTLLNRLLEIVYTFHTGISTNVWVLHHNLGHHLHYLDQAKDESGWKRKDGRTMGVCEYTFTIAITGYPRALRAAAKHPKFQRSLSGMGMVNAVLLGLLLWNNPLNGMIVFLFPMTAIYLGTCWTTYYHHAGLETDDEFHASHNIINRTYNILSGNLGYHTAHHLKQGLHWSELPALHNSIEHEIPPALLSTDFPVVGRLFARVCRSAAPPFRAADRTEDRSLKPLTQAHSRRRYSAKNAIPQASIEDTAQPGHSGRS